MLDGFYAITFRGAADWGMGMIIFHHGKLTGADAGGVVYDGEYQDRGAIIHVKVAMKVPPGVSLVQGLPPQTVPVTFEFEENVDRTAMDTSLPILLKLPPGPVNIIFKKVRELDA